jgi:hypothetical protein
VDWPCGQDAPPGSGCHRRRYQPPRGVEPGLLNLARRVGIHGQVSAGLPAWRPAVERRPAGRWGSRRHRPPVDRRDPAVLRGPRDPASSGSALCRPVRPGRHRGRAPVPAGGFGCSSRGVPAKAAPAICACRPRNALARYTAGRPQSRLLGHSVMLSGTHRSYLGSAHGGPPSRVRRRRGTSASSPSGATEYHTDRAGLSVGVRLGGLVSTGAVWHCSAAARGEQNGRPPP